MGASGAAEIAQVNVDPSVPEGAVVVNSLDFSYPGTKPLISGFNLTLPPGSRCLLAGANGAGKTTLLSILAGKCMVGKDKIQVLGRPPFHDTELTCNGDLSYLGSNWRRNVAFAGFDVPLQGDFPAGKMIYGIEGVDPARRERLIKLLDIDPTWSMMSVSDGQRRRVQICLGLLKPYKVLLCDEITVDLDVVGRMDLLRFFEQECAERGATVIYCTHIFDGLENWFSHLAYMENGKMVHGGVKADIMPLQTGLDKEKTLLGVMTNWLRQERDARRAREAEEAKNPKPLTKPMVYMPSKHQAYMR